MSALETVGLFWVLLATSIFTIATLIAAVWSIMLGLKVARQRYRLGEEMEHTLREPQEQRSVR